MIRLDLICADYVQSAFKQRASRTLRGSSVSEKDEGSMVGDLLIPLQHMSG